MTAQVAERRDSIVADQRRPRLLSRWALASVAAALLALLAWLFVEHGPRALLERQPAAGRPDYLTVAYLRLMVNAHPRDAALRLRLVRTELAVGNPDHAWAQLSPLLDERADVPAHLLAIGILRARAAARPEASRAPLRNRLADEVTAALPRARDHETFEALAAAAREVGRADLAAEAGLGDARIARERRPLRFAEAARLLAHAGRAAQADEAARICAAEMARAPVPLAEGQAAITALLEADEALAALAAAEALLAHHPTDVGLLDRAVTLARARGDLATALRLAERRLALAPDDDVASESLIEIELAAGRVADALPLVERASRLRPNDVERWRKLARVAEWAARPARALVAWWWLADHGDPGALAEALRVARTISDQPAIARALDRLAVTRPLSPTESRWLVDARLALGQTDRAIGELRRHLRAQPHDRRAALRLSALLEQGGRLAEALAVRETLRGHRRPTLVEALVEAGLLDRLRRPRAAFARLRSAHAHAHHGLFLHRYADLAWRTAHWAQARATLRRLFQTDALDVGESERLLLLERDDTDGRARAAVAAWSWRTLREPRLLVLAMDGASRSDRWRELADLLALAADAPERFSRDPHFFELEARLAAHDHRYRDADAALARALALAPTSPTLRVARLWLAIDSDDRSALSELLARWSAPAAAEPEYWSVYAVGLEHLGHLRAALTFYARAAERRPDDVAWLLAFADALDRNGQATASLHVRRRCLSLVGQQLQQAERGAHERDGQHEERRRLTRWIELVHRLRGRVPAERALAQLLAATPATPSLRAFAISYYIAAAEPQLAAAWIRRQQQSGNEVPASQRLAVALAADDRGAAAQILDEERRALPAGEQIAAARQLGRNAEASALVERALGTAGSANEEALLVQAHELAAGRSSSVRADGGVEALGPLTLARLGALIELRRARFHVTASATGVRLTSGGAGPLPPLAPLDELEVSAGAGYDDPRWRARVVAGASVRDGDTMAQAAALVAARLAAGMEGRVEGAWNELAIESATLRALGARDRASAGVTAAITEHDDLGGTVGWRRYHDRAGSELAEGVAAELEAGHRLLSGAPDLRVRLAAAGVWNHLVPTLPGTLATRLRDGARPADVIPPLWATAGVGLTLRYGGAGNETGPAGHLRFLGDLWAGWLLPDNRLAFRVQAGLGVLLPGSNEISASGVYASDLVGGAGQPYSGVDVRFVHRFGN